MRNRAVSKMLVVLLCLTMVVVPLVGGCSGEKEVVEVVKEVPVEKEVVKEVVKEVPVEKVVEKEVVKEVVKEVPVEKETPPEDPRRIYVGSIVDFTGPAATIDVPCHEGFEAYWEWLNQEEGGVDGIKVEVLWTDTRYAIDKALSAYERFKDQGMVAFHGDSMTWAATKDRYPKDKLPYTIAGRTTSFSVWPPNYGYGVGPADSDAGATLVKWWLDTKHTEDRPLKVALMYNDNPYGRMSIDGGFREWLESNPDIEIVEDFPIAPLSTDVSPELTKIKSAGADLILTQCLQPEYAAISQGYRRLGMTMPVAFMATGYGSTIVGPQGIGTPSFDWYWPDSVVLRNQKDIEGVKKTDEIYQEIHRTMRFPRYDFQPSFIMAMVYHHGMKGAIEEAGFENLSGELVNKYIESGEPIDTWGMTKPLTFTPEDHRGTMDMKMYLSPGKSKGVWEPEAVSDWIPALTVLPPWMKK